MEKRLKEVDLYKIYKNWYEGSGAFRCFVRSTNFVSLKHYEDFYLSEVDTKEDKVYEEIYNIVNKYNRKETIFLIDLQGAMSIKSGFLLQKNLKLKPILVLNNPLHNFGLVGNKEYISNLLGYGEALDNKEETKTYVFVLDYDRYGDYSEEELRRSFNNQYELTEEDLPSCEMLKELNYKKVVYICDKEVKEDIKYYLEYLSENQIEVMKESVIGMEISNY